MQSMTEIWFQKATQYRRLAEKKSKVTLHHPSRFSPGGTKKFTIVVGHWVLG